MDVRFYKAAFRGDVSLLTQLLQENSQIEKDTQLQNDSQLQEDSEPKEDSQLLARALRDCSGKNNPLHIAARLGHLDFVKEILALEPQFARELNSRGQAPLHLASAKGHSQVVKELLEAYPDACYLHDKDGTTPLHRAAMKGRVEVLKELVAADEEIAWLLTDQGDPVLHLCVHHNQFKALRTLVEKVASAEFVNLKDDDDNTILHLLAAKNRYEVIQFLLNNNNGFDVNAVNVDGSTALDVSRENPSRSNRSQIRAILKRKGAVKAREIRHTEVSHTWPKKSAQKKQNEKYQNWLSAIKESLMVVATVMASIAFQAALNPPGGVWQDYGYHNSTLYHGPDSPPELIPHRAGESVISYTLPNYYKAITFCTALGLLASLSLILLLVSGFSFQRKISIWILIVTTWIAVASIMVTYLVSYFSLTPPEVIDSKKFWLAVPGVILVWLFLICTVFSVHIYYFVLPHASKLCCLPHECATHFKRSTTI